MVARLHLLLLKLFRRLPRALRLRVVRTLAPQFTVGCICVIERADGAILLVRQSYRGRWGFPGGLLKRGESTVDGVRREVAEEVGLDVTLIGEPTVVVDPSPRRVDVVFLARPADDADPSSTAPRSPEITEVRWFEPRGLPELQTEASTALMAIARARTGSGPGPAAAAAG